MSIFKKAIKWAGRRATEGSTLLGVGTIVAGVVAPKLGLPVDQTAQMVATVLGGLLIGATSKNHPTRQEIEGGL